MTRRPRLYLSGPITKGNRTTNFATAANIQLDLMRQGFSVLNPMLSMLHPDAWTVEHGVWIECDLPWVEVADVVLRLPGESVGADIETAHAAQCGIVVVDSYSKVLNWKERWGRLPCAAGRDQG